MNVALVLSRRAGTVKRFDGCRCQ